jgi:hypothetical protein
MAKHTSWGCDTGENSGVNTAKSETIPGEGKAEYVTDTIFKEGVTKSPTVFPDGVLGHRLASDQPARSFPTLFSSFGRPFSDSDY